MKPASRRQKITIQSDTSFASGYPTLFSGMSTQQDPQDAGTKANQIALANGALVSQPDTRLSPTSDDFSIFSLDLSDESQTASADCASNGVRLDVDRQELLEMSTPTIANHSVDQAIKLCQNEPVLCPVENLPSKNEKICSDQLSLNNSVDAELSPLESECDHLLVSASGCSTNIINILPREQMKWKVHRLVS